MMSREEVVAGVVAEHVDGLGMHPQSTYGNKTPEELGGLRCHCKKWSAPAQKNGIRPWPEFHRHVAREILAALDKETS